MSIHVTWLKVCKLNGHNHSVNALVKVQKLDISGNLRPGNQMPTLSLLDWYHKQEKQYKRNLKVEVDEYQPWNPIYFFMLKIQVVLTSCKFNRGKQQQNMNDRLVRLWVVQIKFWEVIQSDFSIFRSCSLISVIFIRSSWFGQVNNPHFWPEKSFKTKFIF